MSEQQLRGLLRQAVPEAPDLDPTLVRRRALTERRGKVAALVGSAAVLVVVAVTVVAVALSGSEGPRPVPGGVATKPGATGAPGVGSEPRSPYEVPPCPVRLPTPDDATRTVRDLAGVTAVRLCPDLNPRGDQSWEPTAEQRAELAAADALVSDLGDFSADLRSLPPGLAGYCADDDAHYVKQSFAFYRADGTRLLLAATPCTLVRIEGHAVDGGALRDLYLDAVNRQRDELAYTRPFDEELRCTTAQRGGPVSPGRELLVAAVACDLPPGAESLSVGLEPIRLDPTRLAELGRAWARPGAPIIRGAGGQHECVDLEEPPSFIVAATDRGDVVQLFDSPCGILVWHGQESEGATFSTTMAELGLE